MHSRQTDGTVERETINIQRKTFIVLKYLLLYVKLRFKSQLVVHIFYEKEL